MNPTVTCLRRSAEFAALAGEWDALVREDAQGFGGLDATAGTVWFEALCESFAQSADAIVLVARNEAGRLLGLLPLVPLSKGRLGVSFGLPTELHGGRCAPLLMQDGADQVLMQLLLAARRQLPAWTKLQFTLPDGEPLERLQAVRLSLGWRGQEVDAGETAGFVLPADVAELQTLIPAKMRQNLRTAANKLAKQQLDFEVREFSQESQAAELLETMLTIERGSWKHEAGSAITCQPQQQAFYRALFPRALRARQLLGLTLVLQGQAIAYVVGMVRDGVFCCLKHSQLQSQDALSPSSLLMQELLHMLVQRGVRRFDWMGLLEAHKLRWSADNLIYRRRTLWIYSPGWRGRAQALIADLRAARRRRQADGWSGSGLPSQSEAMSCEVLGAHEALKRWGGSWKLLVKDSADDLMGLDATASTAWFEALLASRAQARESRVVTLLQGERLLGLMSTFCKRQNLLGQQLRWTSELYGGRTGLRLVQPQLPLAKALLRGLDRAWPGWVSLQCTVLRDAPSSRLLRQAAADLGLQVQRDAIPPTPYVHLKESPEKFREGVSRSLLRNLRASLRAAEAKGRLSWREYTEPTQADELLAMMLEVERNSWKHEAGSSVSTHPEQEAFYRALLPASMALGQLYALGLFLDDTPISYQLGVQRDSVYSCLKNSMHQGFGELRPSYLLKLELFDRLRARGVRTVDLMGVVEPHKMVWASPTPLYERELLTLYRDNWAGRLLMRWRRLRVWLAAKRRPAPSSSEAAA
ncbi:GNAT family N-acetyltransferase [Inhella sp.]|uniref:GNAT family N-acetyltransferase n=1 Tax=Inhella sp. TaxID=1921806 RepID=UPI0035B0BDA9